MILVIHLENGQIVELGTTFRLFAGTRIAYIQLNEEEQIPEKLHMFKFTIEEWNIYLEWKRRIIFKDLDFKVTTNLFKIIVSISDYLSDDLSLLWLSQFFIKQRGEGFLNTFAKKSGSLSSYCSLIHRIKDL